MAGGGEGEGVGCGGMGSDESLPAPWRRDCHRGHRHHRHEILRRVQQTGAQHGLRTGLPRFFLFAGPDAQKPSYWDCLCHLVRGGHRVDFTDRVAGARPKAGRGRHGGDGADRLRGGGHPSVLERLGPLTAEAMVPWFGGANTRVPGER